MIGKISNYEEYSLWLRDKPREWAHWLAMRSALRVLPLIAADPASSRLHLAAFRAVAMSWAVQKISADDVVANYPTYSARARDAYAAAAAYAARAARTGALADNAGATNAAYSAARATYAAYFESTYALYTVDEADNMDPAAAVMWKEVNRDIAELERLDGDAMLARPLWDRAAPRMIENGWRELVAAMQIRDGNASLWCDWYDRRLRGTDNGFLPYPDDDKILVRRLVGQGRTFWDREFAEVNANIAGWIEELRANDEALATELEQPVPHSIGLRFDASNRLQYDPASNSDALRRDPDAVDRHYECIRLVRKLCAGCRAGIASNSAAELVEECELFAAAMGETIENMRSMLVVMRFVTLEEMLGAQNGRDHDSDIPALPERPLRDLKALVKAAGIMVSLDEELAATYRAKPGLDAFVPISPFAARKLVNSAAAAGLSDASVPAVIALEAKQAEHSSADEAAQRRLSRDTGHIVRRLIGRIMRVGGRGFKNAENAETVGGWLKSGWQWVAQHQQDLLAMFPGRAEIAEWIDQVIAVLRSLGK